MANIKISDLTQASVAADANEFEINEAGTSKKVTGAQISALVESNLGLGALATLSAVGTTQITDGSVTNVKLGADAVDGTKIADDAIDSEHIAADSIDAEHYAPGSVDSTAIASNAVGADELNVTGNGSAGQLLSSDGDGTMTWADAGGGASPRTQLFVNPGTWTKPSGVDRVEVVVIGGGGGSPAGNWNPGGNPGGTSSFGSLVSATGGGGATQSTAANPGNGTISAGTTIKDSGIYSTANTANQSTPVWKSYYFFGERNVGGIHGLTGANFGNNQVYSATGVHMAGSGGWVYRAAGGGGLAHASYVPVTGPQSVTVGAGGNSAGPIGSGGDECGSCRGAVLVKWWE